MRGIWVDLVELPGGHLWGQVRRRSGTGRGGREVAGQGGSEASWVCGGRAWSGGLFRRKGRSQEAALGIQGAWASP